MSIDRNKVLEAAQKHLAKGNLDKAIVEFQRLVAADPKDVRTLLKIGELQARKGAVREACDTYLKVGDSYSSQGFFSKSVAVYKQVVKLDPSRIDAIKKLAQNYEDMQLTGDALAAYDLLGQTYLQRGDTDGALAAMSRATELDPQNLAARIRYAEALSKAGRTNEAAEEFDRGSKQIKAQGRMDDYIKVAERLLFHRENDLALAKELAELYLERNDGKRALAKLQLLFKANPKDAGVLTMLAKAFVSLEQKDKAVQVLKELAKHHQEQNRHEERVRVLQRILEIDPTDVETKQALVGGAQPARPKVDVDAIVPQSAVVGSAQGGRIRVQVPGGSQAAPSVPLPGQSRGPAPSVPRPGTASVSIEPPASTILRAPHTAPKAIPKIPSAPAIQVADEEEDVIVVDDDIAVGSIPPPAAAPAAAASPPAPTARADADTSVEARVAKLLAECEVFARYGLKTKILEQLERILALDPNHREARERLRNAYYEQGRVDDAVEQMIELARRTYELDPTYAVLSLRQALSVQPENPDVRALLRTYDPSYAAMTAAQAAPAPAAAPAPEPPEDEPVLFVDEGSEPSIAPPPPGPDADDVLFLDEASAPAPLPAIEPEPMTAPGSLPDIDMSEPEPWQPSAPAPVEPPRREPAAAPVPSAPPPSVEPLRASASASMPLPAVLADFDDEPPPEPQIPAVLATPVPPSLPPPAPVQAASAPSLPDLADLDPLADDTIDALDAPISPDEFERTPSLSLPPPAATQESAAPVSASMVEEVLDEADFYLAQQLFDDARATVREAMLAAPNHPLLREKLEEIEELAEMYGAAAAAPAQTAAVPEPVAVAAPEPVPAFVPEPAPVAAPEPAQAAAVESLPELPAFGTEPDEIPAMAEPLDAAPATDDDASFALAEKLAEALEEELGPTPASSGAGADSIDVEQVFAQFKAGVEKQVDESDVETHYDLGIAYKEMGLLDDAVGEFSIAARNLDKASVALTMIGLCRVEQGRIDEAIVALEHALAARHRDEREVLGIHFELGNALAFAGRNADAIASYEKVLAKDPAFRGVRERIDALRVGSGNEADQDELERAFDELIGG